MKNPPVRSHSFTAALLACMLASPLTLRAEDLAARIASQVGTPEEPFTVLVRITVKEEGGHDTLLAALEGSVGQTRQEPGNLAFELHGSAADPNEYLLFQTWASVAALKAHAAQPHGAAMQKAIAEASASAPKVEFFLPVVPQPGNWGIEVVREALSKDKVLPEKTLREGLFFLASGYDPATIEVRFDNSKVEGADPNVAPMFRIFRVALKDKTVEAYDPVDDKWLAWGDFLKAAAQP